jgi:hypothetical protein
MENKSPNEKSLILKAYEVKPAETSMSEFKMVNRLDKQLRAYPISNHRFLKHSEMDTANEGDLIGMYIKERSCLFGSILRLKPGEANQITLDQLNSNSISLEVFDQTASDESGGVLKDYSYFCINDSFLILTSSHISRKAVQTYFNWFLNKPDSGSPVCKLEPLLKVVEGTQLDNISSMSISESYFRERLEYRSMTRELALTKGKMLTDLFSDIKTLADIDIENLISASIRLQFRLMKKKDKSEQHEKALKALLQSADSDDILIKTRDGKKIRGGTFERKKQISVETTASGFPHEAALANEMRQFLKELTDETHH